MWLQDPDGWHTFFTLNRKYKQIDALLHVNLRDNVAHSPLKSPFGSIEYSETIQPLILYRFLEFVESRLRAKLVSKIILKNPPQAYRPHHAALLYTFLFNHGYRVADAEVGAVINVTSEKFQNSLHAWEKRRHKQAHAAGLTFKALSVEQLGEIYLFILGCRMKKGYKLSMSLHELKKTVLQFPSNFLVFGVFQAEKLVAASIAVLVYESILYNFFSDHSDEFDQLSPMVVLIEGLYNFGYENNVQLLDLGTSAVDGKPNFGLLDFKMHLGAKPTPKFTFEKNFS